MSKELCMQKVLDTVSVSEDLDLIQSLNTSCVSCDKVFSFEFFHVSVGGECVQFLKKNLIIYKSYTELCLEF